MHNKYSSLYYPLEANMQVLPISSQQGGES